MMASADFVYTRGIQSGVAGQPEPAAAERRRRQRRAGRAAVSQLRLRRMARPERQVGVQGHRHRRSSSGFAKGYAFGVVLHARRFEGQHVRAADDPGLERVPAERARLQRLVRPERLRRPPSPHRELRRQPAARRQRVRCATGSRRASTPSRSGRPFTVNQSGNNVGTNMTGLPNLVGDPDGPKTVDQWFNPAAFQAGRRPASFGNEQRNQLRGPGYQSYDMTAAAADPASARATRRRCAGTCSICSTRPTSACRTGTFRMRRRSGRSPACRVTRGSCSWRSGLRSDSTRMKIKQEKGEKEKT